MIRRPPISRRTDTLVAHATLFLSAHRGGSAQILEAQSHLQRVSDIGRHHPQPMPAKSMPRLLGLTVAAILADQTSRNRKRKLVDMQRRRHSSGSCGRRNLERQLLDKRLRAAE